MRANKLGGCQYFSILSLYYWMHLCIGNILILKSSTMASWYNKDSTKEFTLHKWPDSNVSSHVAQIGCDPWSCKQKRMWIPIFLL